MIKDGVQATILLVDDEEDLRIIYSQVFRNQNINVITAENGKEALDKLESNYKIIDLIVLDVVMPEVDGLDVLEKIKDKDNFKDIPVVISSSLSQPEDKKEAFKLGASEFIVKSSMPPQELADYLKNKYFSSGGKKMV